ncbi:hypothetical protein OH77DRAFT_1528529 [Trametes cingulata]|nr:hypothetical protein OH77DRAFT_1528529 [Trametes cingulata]
MSLQESLTSPFRDYILYRELRGSFSEALRQHGLLFEDVHACSMTLGSLVSEVIGRMEDSVHAYRFAETPGTHIIAAEARPLHPLEIINNGRPRPSTNAIHMRISSIPLSTTLSQLIEQGGPFYKRFVNECTIEDGYLVIHLACRMEPLIFHKSHPDGSRRSHRCISHRIYGRFPSDSFSSASVSEVVTSDGEDAGAVDDHDIATVPASSPSPSPAQSPVGGDTAPNSPVLPAISGPLPRLQRDHPRSTAPTLGPSGSTLLAIHSLPGSIWEQPFEPPVLPGRAIEVNDLPKVVYERAHGVVSGGTGRGAALSRLVVSGGPDVAGLAVAFRQKIMRCCESGDFTEILTPHRTFRITTNQSADAEAQDRTLSVGAGVEREVLLLAFQHYTSAGSRWFTPRMDGFSTITVSQSLTLSRHVSSARLLELQCLGALTALMLINRIAPAPLDPLFLHYLTFNCNLQAVQPSLCAEWHPELRALIQSWLDVGPQGDIAPFQMHFSSYHERELACLLDRDERSHKAIAVEMLYVSVIGSAPPEHPELRAFLSGFRLPCHNGFTFCEIPQAFSGGPAAFWSLIWHMHVSSFSALEDHLDFPEPPPGMCNALTSALGDPGTTPRDLFLEFLKGDGVPDIEALEHARGCFSPSVIPQLELAAQPGFRARMFTWAAAGSTSLGPNDMIRVEFITGSNFEYGPDDSLADSLMEHGKFSIRTCFRQVLIPFPYMLDLIHRALARGERDLIKIKIHTWFLLEILNAIGGHSML